MYRKHRKGTEDIEEGDIVTEEELKTIRRQSKSSAWVNNEMDSYTVVSEVIVHREMEQMETTFTSPTARSVSSIVSATKDRRRKKSSSHSLSPKSKASSNDVIEVPSHTVRTISPSTSVFQSPAKLNSDMNIVPVHENISKLGLAQEPSAFDRKNEAVSPEEQPSDLNETIRLASHIEKVKSKVKTKHKEHLLSKDRQRRHSKQGMQKKISKIGKVAVNGEAELKSLEKEAVREKWKNTLSKTKEVSAGYDFFTQVWPEEVPAAAQVEQQQQQQDEPTADGDGRPGSRPGTQSSRADKEEDRRDLVPEETEDDTKLLAADYLGLNEDEDWEVVLQTAARRPLKTTQLLQKEAALYFYPSSKPVPLFNKLAPGCEPRYPEEEGLYVGSQLRVPSHLRNLMEQRILAAGGRKWFGEDGKLITMPDPQIYKSYNPPMSEECHSRLELEYKLARSQNFGNDHKLLGTQESRSCYLLEVQLLSITFTHHPLFSREHVLSQQLTSLFRQYAAQQERDSINRLFRKLDALRKARDSCVAAQDELPNEDSHKQRLQRYKEEILQTQLKLLEEGRASRHLLARILSLWKDLRTLRQLQGYSCTPLQLRVMCQPPGDREKEQREWEHRLHIWTKELLSEKLKSQGQSGNTQQKMHISKKLQGKDEPANSSGSTENENEHESETEPYTDLDEATVCSDLANSFRESFRPPGEPDVVISLNNNNSVDQDPSFSREQKRRSAVLRTKLFVKIFYNEKEVCQSNIASLTDKFEVKFEQLFNICVLQHPDSLKLEIWEESSALNKNIIADVYIPPPNSATTLLNCETGYHEFSNNMVITFNHTGVGSGTFCPPLPGMQSASNSLSCLYTSGIVECRTGWGKDEISGEIMAPPEKSGLRHSEPADFPVSLRNQDGNLDPQKLKEWAEKSHLDPNDPRNASFFYFLKNTEETSCRENSYFRLDPLQTEFDFCTAEELDSNPRLRLLKLRDRGEPEFRGLHLVPLREKEILPQIFVEYDKRISVEPKRSHDELPPDPLESHRIWGQRFLLDVQQRILQQCHAAQQNKQPQDIVSEDQVPDIGTLGLTIMKWLQPKRPLRPVRKERRKVTTQSISTTEVKIIINIVRAFDVPVRKDVDTLGITTVGPQGCKFTLVPVRPFVEVSFQDTVCRTTTAEGANPTWNQELQILLRPPGGDYSHGTLQSIKDSVHFNLFDEIVIDLLADDSIRETNIHQRLERNWLGSLQIPFSTLYFNSQVEGTFKLYSPPVLLGYERESQLSQLASLSLSGDSQLLQPQNDATFLTLFITVQPPLNPPELLKEKLESTELPHVQEHLEKWEEQMLAEFPHRKVKTLVTDISGKTVCVTRFFRALAPPDLCGDDGPVTAEMAARYVAMIPVISGNTLFPGLFDVWLTSDQVVRLLSGDCEDHAVLLCCYLLHLGMQAWLLLGVGVPHGPAAYVLTRDAPGTFRIWDPVSGQACNITDTFCPLQKTYCLINEDNVWANIQNEEMPHRTRFDVSRKSDWYPAFGRNVSAPTGSVQPPSLEYSETSLSAVQQLQDKIEKYLQKNIMHWRKTSRTIWNRYCIAILRKLLPEMETASLKSKELGIAEHIHELQQILGSHKVCGFPINMPYTNMEAINETVKATGVHNTENEETEFALAVYVHPYPGNVLSVWIYVASLIKRR
ncbi:coiled-coil and C2 domain-containing protein 2A [Schistocerca gregaria]|uniref:coiled-coil and C2 domain-containing protein 2A n=1 Tax=Schistocerca gregaria TaxID=7010 RepID=UPI00211DBD6E|nr:coiled-coil and C2 domain-containing protein 2A [Schistocerca gregaria]